MKRYAAAVIAGLVALVGVVIAMGRTQDADAALARRLRADGVLVRATATERRTERSGGARGSQFRCVTSAVGSLNGADVRFELVEHTQCSASQAQGGPVELMVSRADPRAFMGRASYDARDEAGRLPGELRDRATMALTAAALVGAIVAMFTPKPR